MSPPYPAASIANYFLAKDPMDQLKLQKLVYFAQGWYLAGVGRPLIDEAIEAWRYGPVVPSLYQDLKRHGAKPIEQLIPESDPPPLDSVAVEALDFVWRSYGDWTGGQLVSETHRPGTPWDEEYDPTISGKDIPNRTIKTYFEAKLAELTKQND